MQPDLVNPTLFQGVNVALMGLPCALNMADTLDSLWLPR